MFVLVHGAFQGAWVWSKIKPVLQLRGYKVFTPTLAGLGARSSELNSAIGLEDHIRDVCKVIDENDLNDITLIGHSYGGIVVSGVAKQRADKISSLLYLDAPIPEDNQSLLDVLGADFSKPFIDAARETGEGWRVDSFAPAIFGLSAKEDIDWAMPQHTAQSLKSFTDKVSVLTSEEASHIKIGYIFCSPGNPFTQAQVKRADEKGWLRFNIEAAHSPMITDPEKLVDLLCTDVLPRIEPVAARSLCK